jgi:hypothetical protein
LTDLGKSDELIPFDFPPLKVEPGVNAGPGLIRQGSGPLLILELAGCHPGIFFEERIER